MIVALGSLVLAMMQGQTWGWGSTGTLGLFGLAAVTAIGSVWWELRIDEPLISPALLSKGNFAIDNAVLARSNSGSSEYRCLARSGARNGAPGMIRS